MSGASPGTHTRLPFPANARARAGGGGPVRTRATWRAPPPARPDLVRPVRRPTSPPRARRLVRPPSTPGWCLAGARSTLGSAGAVRCLWALPAPPRPLRRVPPRRRSRPRGPALSVYARPPIRLERCPPRLGGVSCETSRGEAAVSGVRGVCMWGVSGPLGGSGGAPGAVRAVGGGAPPGPSARGSGIEGTLVCFCKGCRRILRLESAGPPRRITSWSGTRSSSGESAFFPASGVSGG